MGIGNALVQPFIQRSNEPRLNSLFLPILGAAQNFTSNLGVKKNLMNWYKKVPELTAIVDMVAESIASSYHFEPIKDGDAARNKILQAEEFAKKVRYSQMLQEQQIDELVTGESFVWLGWLSDGRLKDFAKNFSQIPGLESKSRNKVHDKIYLQLKAENTRPNFMKVMASTSVNIIHDGYTVKNYSQHVFNAYTTEATTFDPKEVLHFKHMSVDGKIEGFTPLSGNIVPQRLLSLMWLNQEALQQNGGHPDKIFTLKDVQPGSPAYKQVEQQLRSYKTVTNKHGNMLWTGQVDVIDLMNTDAMLFKEVGLYVASVLAMHWNVPKSFLPYVVDGTNSKSDVGGASERMFWNRIEKIQDRISNEYNRNLWNKYFGVNLVFDKEYKQDEAAENTAIQLKLGNIEMMNRLLANVDSQITKDKMLLMLGLRDGDIEEKKEDPLATGMLRQGMLPQNHNKPLGQDDNARNAQKQNEQVARAKQAGGPSGMGPV